jgi:hypothetical protein
VDRTPNPKGRKTGANHEQDGRSAIDPYEAITRAGILLGKTPREVALCCSWPEVFMVIRADSARQRGFISEDAMGVHLAFGAAHSEKAGGKFKAWLNSMAGISQAQDVKKNRSKLAATLRAKGAKNG